MLVKDNKKANYYRVIGHDLGAYKSRGRWVGVRIFGHHPELRPNPLIRWQGPPSKAIEKALRSPTT